ncbi:TetR family transcriptional regulator (plasmid) [Phyllobacterium sp. 628]|uniref:TetR family transcriptional regulator n=1 Tax=Phyllobacterium sp. 628 TaxID=2718938 RepID=UPI001662221C|nr:TetR family transcriptional regulator [Phyllobacterium sp. 628]QND54714.1 TetR family transcriptional regulator [Phyllobacterium sp. 628]
MRRTKAEAGETREAILDSAETVFLEHGVNQSTLNQIAEHAGVTRGAIYFHFKDKLQLYQDVVERVRLPQDDLLAKAFHCENSDPLDVALDAGIFCLENFAGDQRKQRVFTIITQRCEYVGEMAQVLQRLSALNEEVQQMLLRLTRLARKRGVLSPQWEPEIAARALQSTMSGLLFEWMRLEKSFDLVAAGSQTMTAIVDSLRKKAIPVQVPVVRLKKQLVA